jgi:hypothetical protein
MIQGGAEARIGWLRKRGPLVIFRPENGPAQNAGVWGGFRPKNGLAQNAGV